MQIEKSLFRIPTALLVLLMAFRFLGFTSPQENPHFALTQTEKTSQKFSIAGSSPVWYALTAENSNNFTTQQETSGGGIGHFPLQDPFSLSFQKPAFSHPSFNWMDRRMLIFQYLYPFYFFF